MAAAGKLVRAAGGLLWRTVDDGRVEVLLVHRPRYDDWSFPKGKCDPGETFEQTARREVREETGFEVELGAELPEVRYTDHRGRPKVVRYWAMSVTGGAFVPNEEVDEVRWTTLRAAADRLTYPHDVALLDLLPVT